MTAPQRSRRARALLALGTLALVALASSVVQPASAAQSQAQKQKKPLVCAGPKIARPGGGYWKCSFDDEFNAKTLNRTKWDPVTTANSGFVNGPECYVGMGPNIVEANGVLTLSALQLPAPMTCTKLDGTTFDTDYTAATVSTKGHFSQDYGRFAVRARFGATTVSGLQTSLWMYPANTSKYADNSGEIDLGEEYSQTADRAVPTIHYPYSSWVKWSEPKVVPGRVNPLTGVNESQNAFCMFQNPAAFHTYVLTWSPTDMRIQYDGNVCLDDHYVSSIATKTSPSAPFDVPFFLVLTQALGIDTNAFQPGVTPLPARTIVDWVRAWK